MILSKLGFRDYFHNYLVLEADTLTDSLKDKIAVAEEDKLPEGAGTGGDAEHFRSVYPEKPQDQEDHSGRGNEAEEYTVDPETGRGCRREAC